MVSLSLREHPPATSCASLEASGHIGRRRAPELSDRELEVLRLLAEGVTSGEIARRLTLTTKTVRNHVSRICTKLQVLDRVQAVLKRAKPTSSDAPAHRRIADRAATPSPSTPSPPHQPRTRSRARAPPPGPRSLARARARQNLQLAADLVLRGRASVDRQLQLR